MQHFEINQSDIFPSLVRGDKVMKNIETSTV